MSEHATHDAQATTPKAADSGGAEQGPVPHEAWGDPAGWSWDEPLRVAARLVSTHPGYWIRLTLVGAAMAVIPLLPLVVGPLLAVLVVGGAVDQLQGEGEATISGTLARWRPRVLPCYLAQFLGMTLMGLLFGFAGGGALATWGGIRLVSLEASQHPGVVAAVALGALAVLAVGFLVVLRWTLFHMLGVVLEGDGQLAALQRSARLFDANCLGILGVGAVIAGLGMVLGLVGVVVLFPFHFGWTLGVHLLTESELLRLVLGLPMDFLGAILQMGVGNLGSIAWVLVFLRLKARARG